MFRLLICILLLPSLATAASINATTSWDIDPTWSQNTESSWINLDIDDTGPLPVAPRRLAVAFFNGNTEILRIWDTPVDRSVNVGFDLTTARARITLQPFAYEGQPWQPSTAYALGDKLAVGGFPSGHYWFECTRAGTTGTTQPTWPEAVQLTAGNIIDNGGGTVNIPATAHGYVAGDIIDFYGLTNYAGPYTLPAQTNGDANTIEITETYTAETIGVSAYARSRVQDPDGSGTEWKFTTGTQLIMTGEPTGRVIVKDNGSGQAKRTGTNFIVRYQ